MCEEGWVCRTQFHLPTRLSSFWFTHCSPDCRDLQTRAAEVQSTSCTCVCVQRPWPRYCMTWPNLTCREGPEGADMCLCWWFGSFLCWWSRAVRDTVSRGPSPHFLPEVFTLLSKRCIVEFIYRRMRFHRCFIRTHGFIFFKGRRCFTEWHRTSTAEHEKFQ